MKKNRRTDMRDLVAVVLVCQLFSGRRPRRCGIQRIQNQRSDVRLLGRAL